LPDINFRNSEKNSSSNSTIKQNQIEEEDKRWNRKKKRDPGIEEN
jgi:hypothetical protein